MKYAILGAGGCFGLNTAHWLLDQGHEVLGIGRAPLRSEPFSLGIEKRKGFTYHALHLVDDFSEVVGALKFERPDIIVNYLALSDVALSWRYPECYYRTNLAAQVDLVEALVGANWLHRFIHIGSSEVYGSVVEPAKEDAPINATSPYSVSKAAFDLHLLSVARVKGFPATILRPSNCYCPGQLLYRVIPKAVVCGLTGRQIPLQGGGKAEKSFMHATDLSRGIEMVGNHPFPRPLYNLGPDRWHSIREIVEATARAIDVRFEDLVEEAPGRVGEDSRYAVNSDLFREEFGWRPEISLTDGLFGMAEWGTRYLDQLRTMPLDYVFRR